MLNDISVWWHVVGVAVIVGVLTFVPDRHQSADFVFTEFVNNTGWSNTFYVALIGLLLAQYTLTGFDASAHMTEETRDASTAGPRGIVMSIAVSIVAGWVLLVGVTFAIQDYDGAIDSGVPPAQIFIDAVGETGGKALLLIVIVAQLFCGMSSVTANSRMIYAFSRDGALPASQVWHRINPRTRTPTNAIWLAAAGSFLLGLPYLWNVTAYAAVTSIAVIGLYIAYVLPTLLRLMQGESFQRGPWHLGRWSRPIGIIAVAWVAFITVLFMLPQVSPVRPDDVQLHAGRGARRHRLRRHLVARLRPALVQGPEGPGFGRRAGRDRARPGARRVTVPMRRGSGRLDLEGLRVEVEAGRLDTVLLVIADMQGRLQGKRMAAEHLIRDVLPGHGPPGTVEGCDYLLAVDVDMNTVDGYALLVLVAGLRRPGLAPGPGHDPVDPLARGDRADPLRRRAGRRHAGGTVAPAGAAPAA